MHFDLVVLCKGLLSFLDSFCALDECIRAGELALADLLDVDGVGALRTQAASVSRHIVEEP